MVPTVTVGTLVGCWSVPCVDKPRPSRKLFHAFQATLAMRTWQAEMETRLTELHPDAGCQMFPPLQLQDFFTSTRQLPLRSQIEETCRGCVEPRKRTWTWDEQVGKLTWQINSPHGPLPAVVSPFPDEPQAVAYAHIDRLARQFRLT